MASCSVFLSRKRSIEILDFASKLSQQAWFLKTTIWCVSENSQTKGNVNANTQSITPHLKQDTQDTHTHAHISKHPDTFDAMYPTMNPGSLDEWGSHASPKECRAQPPPLSIHTHTHTHTHMHTQCTLYRWPHSLTQTHTGAFEYDTKTNTDII